MKSPCLFLSLLVFLAPSAFCADDTSAMLARFDADRSSLTEALAKSPGSVPLLSRRGDANLFTARFAEAVADYEKMIALDPSEDNPHWRLGIAYYLTGDFKKAALQFQKYQQHESGDRENGIWHFMSTARARDIETARKEMIVFTRFDREPFPGLYDLFAGKLTTDALFADLKARDLADNPGVQFFAKYYAGVWEDLQGHKPRAIELLREAVKAGETREDYMWQVCRVQLALLESGK